MNQISIITINKNNKLGLKKTCESVLKQRDSKFEWIIIDGNSCDGSQTVVDIDRCVLVSESDNGIYDAMNKGIKLASGNYILFLNSGDCFCSPKSIELLKSAINSNPDCEILRFGVHLSGSRHKELTPADEISGFYLFKNSIPHQGTITKRALLIQYPFDQKYKICADYHFFLRQYLLNDIKDAKIQDIIVDFDTSGVSSQNSMKTAEERKNAFIDTMGSKIYKDYVLFSEGRNLAEHIIGKLTNNFILYLIGLSALLPCYLIYIIFNAIKHPRFYLAYINNHAISCKK